MSKVKIHIKAQEFHSHKGGRYRAGSVQMVDPEEAAELVKAGIANYAHPLGQAQTAMALGQAAETRADRVSREMAASREAAATGTGEAEARAAAAEERAAKAEAELAARDARIAELQAKLAEVPPATESGSELRIDADAKSREEQSAKKNGRGKAPKEG